MSPAETIRHLLRGGATINMPGVYDTLSSRLAAEAGFEVMFISGYSVSAARLGTPDFGYLTQPEIAEVARGVCSNSGGRPVIVDADTGYGNALNTIRTARMLHAAGAAGVFLEDQEWPKKCGHFAGKRVVPRGDWLAKLQAIVDLREQGVDLFLVARTDARAAVSLEEAIERANAAREIGVDAIFVEAPRSEDELRRVAAEVPDVVRVANMIEGGRTPLYTPAELHDLGYDLIVTPLTGLFAATKAMKTAYARLRDNGTLREDLDLVTSFSEFESVVDLEGHRQLEHRYET
ncbi:MAG: isocitrate lyase/PEP mutase family protein [Thermoleophilia bacterium]|nr:isocitrate lyase/PEP mutase family protein [Thermoleophilia bacterium]